jgi:hypothetical protein
MLPLLGTATPLIMLLLLLLLLLLPPLPLPLLPAAMRIVAMMRMRPPK